MCFAGFAGQPAAVSGASGGGAVNAFLAIEESDPRVRETLDPGIWVEARDKDPRDEDPRQAEYIATMRKLCRGIKVFAIPNAGKRTQWAAAKAKREGMHKGWPDTGACWVTNIAGGVAWIEFKNGKEMPEGDQIETLNWLHRRGHPVAVCRTAQGAMSWLKSIGAPVPVREGL
jgi:hypothetical protein